MGNSTNAVDTTDEEKLPSLLGVARSAAFGEHLSPGEVGPGGEGLRTHPVADRGGLGEVGVRLVVAAEDGGETAEGETERPKNCYAARSAELICKGSEPFEQYDRSPV